MSALPGSDGSNSNKRERPSNSPFKARSVKGSLGEQEYMREQVMFEESKIKSGSKRDRSSNDRLSMSPKTGEKKKAGGEEEEDYEDEFQEQEPRKSPGMDESKGHEDSYGGQNSI